MTTQLLTLRFGVAAIAGDAAEGDTRDRAEDGAFGKKKGGRARVGENLRHKKGGPRFRRPPDDVKARGISRFRPEARG